MSEGRGADAVAAGPAGVAVRPVAPHDAEGAARLLNEVIASGRFSLLDTPFSADAERRYIESFPARGVFHVAELAGEGVVGMQCLEPYGEYATHAHDHVLTMGTWVREPHRRRGIGRRLAAASFEAARAKGFEKIFTDIRADNVDSVAFHRALGFTVVGTARRHAKMDGRYFDVVFVEKFL